MESFLDKCRENQNTRFMFHNLFLFFENHTVYEIMSKNFVEKLGPQMTSQYDAYVFHAGLARLHAWYAHAHAHAPGYPMHARMHAHTPISNTYCFSTATVIRERGSLLRRSYIAPLV